MAKAKKDHNTDATTGAAVDVPNSTVAPVAVTEAAVVVEAPKAVEPVAPVKRELKLGLNDTKADLQTLNVSAEAQRAKRQQINYEAAARVLARQFRVR